MDYIYKKSGALFNAHSYWTKQPVEVIRTFIEANTRRGDVVLDPFCGSGMTGVAAIQSNRKFILSDISPVCVHIAKGYCNKLQKKDVHAELSKLLSKITYLYETKCPYCGKKIQFDYAVLEDQLEKTKKLRFDRMVLHCDCQKNKILKKPDYQDLKIFASQGYKNFFYPKDEFFGNEPKRNYKRGIKRVYQLYSNRNLTALSILRKAISEIKDESIKQLFLFAFTSILFNCSLMSRYNPKYENTQIKMGTFYIPQFIKDNNVPTSFKRKVHSILKANDETFHSSSLYDGQIMISDATNLSHIEDQSVDYIYTDPPYSDKISYSELNIVYEAWIGNGLTNSKREMIVSKAAGKSIDFYSDMFKKFMAEAFRVLKNGKKLTIIFHNSSITHWKYFQEIVNVNGFKPVIKTEPDRLVSFSKTSTQHQTDNDSQCFLAFNFVRDKKYKCDSSLKELNNDVYKQVVAKIRKEAVKNGFQAKCDQFDYIINRLLFKYKIKENIKI